MYHNVYVFITHEHWSGQLKSKAQGQDPTATRGLVLKKLHPTRNDSLEHSQVKRSQLLKQELTVLPSGFQDVLLVGMYTENKH